MSSTALSTPNFNLGQAKQTRPVGEVQEKQNTELKECLNAVLANEFGLFTKTLKYHWSVTGPRFYGLHLFLDGHYKQLLEMIDEVAERIRVLGEHPLSTLQEVESKMVLHEGPGKIPSADDMLNDLLRDHLTIQEMIKSVVAKEKLFACDPGTQDLLIGALKKHETMSWMLKSHLDR